MCEHTDSKALYKVGFPGGSVVKNLPAMQETRVRSLRKEDRRAIYSPRGHKSQT